ncbi:MAG TPA: NADH-ubiquinone oxidoreductase-F iron-sulfur binding region domain-containing protein [Myxococcota bacterium]|nr:NADH-ubiquinone oxidoreductase-F iron-sulfur binding region domain-containing protein [Myxococcota bacterium]
MASFYHLRGASLAGRACAGTACFVARHRNAERWSTTSAAEPRVYCIGKCYASPSAFETTERPIIGVRTARPVVLERIAAGGAPTLARYTAAGGYRSLARALDMPPDRVIAEIEASGLRGRGGAGFPTGRKLRSLAAQCAVAKYVVMNADEGDPGAYIDRILLEDDPHAALEGLSIAAYATQATRGFIYLRREYPDALTRLGTALEDARAAGFLGEDVLHRGFRFDVDLVVGEGSYVCGEETALLHSIEGVRPFVRSRPPHPSERGLFGAPTVVNNVETLANLPWILGHGAHAYASMGFSESRGTKVLSLNSLFARPGLYEVELGIPVRHVVEEVGGGLARGTLRGVLIGGPLAGVLPPGQLDVPLAFEEMRAAGASVGHGGVIAFDEDTSIADLMHHVFSFGAYESCGRCTPCRLGARHIERMTRASDTDVPWDLATFEDLVSALGRTSLCGHGSGLAEFADSILRYYREELLACFASS